MSGFSYRQLLIRVLDIVVIALVLAAGGMCFYLAGNL